jgi:thiol:disulfide interchange protein
MPTVRPLIVQTRLAKYYTPLGDEEKTRTEDEVYRLIANRDAKYTNFLEVLASWCVCCWEKEWHESRVASQ